MISRVACSPVSFGILTSRIARSGRSRIASSRASAPSAASADDLDVGLALEQQPQPGADDAVVVGDQDPHQSRRTLSTGTRGRTVVPSPGPRLDRQLAADQQRPLAHAGDPEAALGLVEGEAAAVVGDLELDPRRRRGRRRDLDPLGAREWRAAFASASWATR